MSIDEKRLRAIAQGKHEIDSAEWKWDGYDLVLVVKDQSGLDVKCFLSRRPNYCDRGHFHLLVDGRFSLDSADSFPRYFFSFDEADKHTRDFLKWRLWQVSGKIGMDQYFRRAVKK